jgi:hypothetical protein
MARHVDKPETDSSTPMAIDELSYCYRVLNAYTSIEILKICALDPAAVRSTPAGGCCPSCRENKEVGIERLNRPDHIKLVRASLNLSSSGAD